ncbi:MAG: alpha/beta hydrolase [Myxococcales bacterium]|nr:alpha/beta hydrolase [Myxococcales bacterium]
MEETTLETIRGGAGPGPLLVFLHEGLGSARHFKDFPEIVARACGCPTLVYSRRGHGSSPPLSAPRRPAFMHDAATDELAPLLADHDGPRILIGHSDGASIALLYAALVHDPALLGVVAIAPHVFVESVCVDAITQLRRDFPDSSVRRRLGRYHADVDHTFFAWADIWLDPQFRSWNIESALQRVDVPVLVIQGTDDAYGTLDQVDAVARGCSGPVDRMLLAACGHSPPRERPHLTAAAITGFVSQHMAATES